jgi:hypothetical protein
MAKSCENCGKFQLQKLTGLYARWYPEGKPSVGYVLGVCDECLESNFAPKFVSSVDGFSEMVSCPLCAGGLEDQLDYTWVTGFARREQAQRFVVIGCSACATRFRAGFQSHGRRLEDREAETSSGGASLWRRVGIEPQTS